VQKELRKSQPTKYRALLLALAGFLVPLLGPACAGTSSPVTHQAAQTVVASSVAPEVPVSAEQLLRAARLVEETRQATRRFEDINVARQEGYTQYTAGVQEPAYFWNWEYERDGRILDPERPEILIYAQTAPDQWQLVGVEFTTESPERDPPELGGPLTVWHNHTNLCFAPSGMLVSTNATPGTCPGTFVAKTSWMLHVWLTDNPNGVFAYSNPSLRFFGAATQEVQWMIEYGHMPVSDTAAR
jgi:hypothetical protein